MKDVRVLFLGNSHTFFNDMPQIFKMFCQESGAYRTDVSMLAHPGVTFGWHLSQGSDLRFSMLYGGYDYIILQQAAHSPCPSKGETVADGTKIINLARENGVTPLITVPWAERHDPAHQAEMYDIYSELAAQTGTRFSPVGQVFERVLKEHPEIDLYWHDGEHCSPYGSYVVAATVFSRLFERSPEGLPARSFSNMSGTKEEMAQVKALMDAAKAQPEKKELMAQAWAEYKAHFHFLYEKEALPMELDGDKCAILQKLVWEEVSKVL